MTPVLLTIFYFLANQAASDLAATNIQRGRDHGLGSYNSARQVVGLNKVVDMRQKPPEISQENWDILAKLYKSPDDIDLYTGGLAEDHTPGVYPNYFFTI